MNAAELIDRFDLADPTFIADPYPLLNELREATPLFFNAATSQWTVTRFADVAETLRDRRLGRVYRHRFTDAEFGRPDPDPRWRDFDAHERWSLLQLEPPDHTRIRQLITKVFTPRAVLAMRPQIEAFADQFLAACAERDEFDLIADYAQPYSVAVICSTLGVPRTDTSLLLDWSHAIVKMYELTTSEEQKFAANKAAAQFMDYTRQLIAEKRRHPDRALIAQLARVEDEGAVLSDDEIMCTVIVLLNAGHEATVNTLGNGMRAFMHHRDQWLRVTSSEVTARTALEEMIRWDPPLQLFERWVLDDGVVIAGQSIERGREVAMLFGAANRDPRRFPDPDRFDAGRGDSAHIGFGGGIHYCVGAPLARAEIDVSLAGLAARFPGITLAREPSYHPTFVIRGLRELRLRP